MRLFGGTSRCDGTLQMKQHREWRPVVNNGGVEWNQKVASVVCHQLNCGSAVSTKIRDSSSRNPVWQLRYPCAQADSLLNDCLVPEDLRSSIILEVICSGNAKLSHQ